jgi:hypothetical protein
MILETEKRRGVLPLTVAYEYLLYWMRGRIPTLKSLSEVLGYLNGYFKIMNLAIEDYINAARIKFRGDEILAKSSTDELQNRRLSIIDSTVIMLAFKKKITNCYRG